MSLSLKFYSLVLFLVFRFYTWSRSIPTRCSKPAEADAIHADEADVPLLAYAVTCAFVLYAGSGGKF